MGEVEGDRAEKAPSSPVAPLKPLKAPELAREDGVHERSGPSLVVVVLATGSGSLASAETVLSLFWILWNQG